MIFKSYIHFIDENILESLDLFHLDDIKKSLELECFNRFFMINDIASCGDLNNIGKGKKYEMIASCIASGINPNEDTLFFESNVMNHYELGALLNMYDNEIIYKHFKHQKTLENCIEIAKTLIYAPHYYSKKNNKKLESFITQLVYDFNKDIGTSFEDPCLFKPNRKCNIRLDTNILLTDSKERVFRRLKGFVTDSDNKIYYDPINKPHISNILEIFSFCSGKGISQLENHYSGMNSYETFKMDCAEAINTFLEPIQKIFYEIRPDEKYLETILTFGKNKAKDHADIVLTRVKEELGIL